jgi:hypothetical protein
MGPMESFFPLAYGQVTYRRTKRGNTVVEDKRPPHLQTRILFSSKDPSSLGIWYRQTPAHTVRYFYVTSNCRVS